MAPPGASKVAIKEPGIARGSLQGAGHGAWKIATTKRPDRTIVIDADEHLSYLEPAAALSGVRSMHRSSVYHRARQGPREPIRLAWSDGRARI